MTCLIFAQYINYRSTGPALGMCELFGQTGLLILGGCCLGRKKSTRG